MFEVRGVGSVRAQAGERSHRHGIEGGDEEKGGGRKRLVGGRVERSGGDWHAGLHNRIYDGKGGQRSICRA